MSYTTIDRRTITIYDIPSEVKDRMIESFIRKYVSNARWTIDRGTAYAKHGVECQRIYVKFEQSEDVNEFMSKRSFQLNGKTVKVIRKLPKTFVLHDRCVTGLKVNIVSNNERNKSTTSLCEGDLRSYFESFGPVRSCQWKNSNQTEALFVYENYDSVDRAILENPKATIKGIEIILEKKRSEQDFFQHVRPYVVHMTNLPVNITSERLSNVFAIPIADILLYPCFDFEETNVVNGRDSSEAWIYGFEGYQHASMFAKNHDRQQIDSSRIEYEATLEPIEEMELCKNFQIGRCAFMNDCIYKHFTCDEPENCEDEACLYGHLIQRKTQSKKRTKFHQTRKLYRLRLSNLPSNVTKKELKERLGLNAMESGSLIFQRDRSSNRSTQVVYFTRQRLHNKLRQQSDKWHKKPFSKAKPQLIQCQIEIDQEYFDWNDDRQASPTPISNFVFVQKDKRSASIVSTASLPRSQNPTNSAVTSSSNQKRNSSTNVVISNPLRSESVQIDRSAPPDMINLLKRWKWTNLMMKNNDINDDQCFWLDDRENRENDVVVKIYSSNPNQVTSASEQARREYLALTKLKGRHFAIQLIESNVDSPGEEFWTIIKPMFGEKLSTYAKKNPLDLGKALSFTRQILDSVKQMHNKGVVHRQIRPENILVQKSSNQLKFVFINFDSAWIDEVSTTNSFPIIDDYAGNDFYRMPQFEIESTSNFRQSPKIDATGVCAILFWFITGKYPKESKDINGIPPHRLSNHEKIITKKIQNETAFGQESRTDLTVKKNLVEIFDRCFGDPEQQMTVDELHSALQNVFQSNKKNN